MYPVGIKWLLPQLEIAKPGFLVLKNSTPVFGLWIQCALCKTCNNPLQAEITLAVDVGINIMLRSVLMLGFKRLQ